MCVLYVTRYSMKKRPEKNSSTASIPTFHNCLYHRNDVLRKLRRLTSPATWLFTNHLPQANHRKHQSSALPHFPWTSWPPFRKRYFQMPFREWTVMYFEDCSFGVQLTITQNWFRISGFRIQEMFIQYNYISNLFTYITHRLSWLG